MATIKKIWSNVYVRQTVYAVVTIAFLIFLISVFLNIYTRHAQSQPVPDFKGMTMDSVKIIAKQNKLRIEVIDSVFVTTFSRGTVFEQNPKANVQVKKNRKIFLTMNLMSPRKMPVPNVVNYSLRQAKAELIAKGFTVGRLSYQPDLATNNVLAQKYKGQKVSKDDMLPMGSKIDLVVGLNADDGSTNVPNVNGLLLNNACDVLIDNSLNVGKLNFDASVKTISDSLNSRVYKQSPASGSGVSKGSEVILYLKPDK